MFMMKKIQILLLGLMFSLPCNLVAQTFVYGDVNGDGEVNISDVNAVIGVILGDNNFKSIMGSWISEYAIDDNGERFDIPTEMCVSLTFDEDQTGLWGSYVYYSSPDHSYYSISYEHMKWEQQARRLYIWLDDGYHEEMYYGFNVDGYLLISLNAQLTQYTALCPVDNRYPLGSSRPDKVSRHSDSAVASKSIFRSVIGGDQVIK